MIIFIKLGFRNIFRNKRRSLLTSFAIGVAVCALIITDGFMEGMSKNMIETATSGILGHAQIHNRQYIKKPSTEFVIKEHKVLEDKLNKNKMIKSWSRRVYSLGMIASPRNSRNISLIGIDSQKEILTTDTLKFIKEGSLLSSKNTVIIGTELKKKLGVEIGSKVVLTTSQAKTGEIVQDVFRVGGIISFGSKKVDGTLAFIHIEKLQEMIKLGKNYHEIVLNLGSPFNANEAGHPLWKYLSNEQNLARGWQTLTPGLAAILDMSSLTITIIGIIMMILMGLIIFNTLFMAIFERLFEFGVVRALGTENKHLIMTMLAESTGLGFLSSLFGVLLALIIGGLLAYYGIDYGGIEFNSVTFREPIRFIFRAHQWFVYPLITILFTTLVGIYPAIYTIRLDLSDALKKTL
jgi:ABC-type lipoprotein release transport system permease subunit